MTRPLVITDCDEVLLHMINPYRHWLAEVHGIGFVFDQPDFSKAMRHGDGSPVATKQIWELLGAFFDTEMHRQPPIAGAVEAVATMAQLADVVVLTNLEDKRQAARTAQLAGHGIAARVFTNTGPKGPAIRAIIDEYRPSHTVFIDDLPQHHGSAAEVTPDVTRLHFCGEPLIAGHIACAHRAGHAHARIDTWEHALPWVMARIEGRDQ